jgi:hypothetical protein
VQITVKYIELLMIGIAGDYVTKRMTRWWQGWLTTLSDDVVNIVWWRMWLLLTTPDNLSDDQNMTLTKTGDSLGWSMWCSVDNPKNFLDDIWQLRLAIFVVKAESFLSCCHSLICALRKQCQRHKVPPPFQKRYYLLVFPGWSTIIVQVYLIWVLPHYCKIQIMRTTKL